MQSLVHTRISFVGVRAFLLVISCGVVEVCLAQFPGQKTYLPTKKWQRKDELFTGWMLLSYRKPATASSYRDVFAAANVTDENPRTFWVAASNKAGEWLTLDLGSPCEVRAVQVNFTDYKSGLYASDASQRKRGVDTELVRAH